MVFVVVFLAVAKVKIFKARGKRLVERLRSRHSGRGGSGRGGV